VKLAICMTWLLAGTLALAAGAGESQAKNPRIPTILSLFKAGKLEQAEAELRLARAYEGNTSVDLGQLSILDGMIAAVNADDEQARAAFRRALALDPQAALPEAATAHIRKLFEAVRAEPRAAASTTARARASGSGAARNLPAEFEQQYSVGKLEDAEAFLNTAGAQSDLSQVESGQILVLKGLVEVLKKLRAGAAPDRCRSYADDLEAVEARLAEETATAKLSEAESAQFLALRGSLLVVRGVLRVESGEQDRAKASFRKALEVNPRAKLPSLASAKARRLFNETKAAVPAARGPKP